ncbi:MAG: SUMF1/EgtB/PvdO family nonheme iron enzyme [Anaerolineales bacterium]|jgi:formylglycine-generating enzyme required for sulfatase activity/tRNA A-37 threonylcarbamoyl transferase component Bud32|nr:SUMF1/EgtB/PvdO family nonheme iron enzyme [Anaerolineales bacterium]
MSYSSGDLILTHYRIEALIGRGASGEVYLVTHLELNALRAVKVLCQDAPGLSGTEYHDFQDRFRLEAQLGAKIDHPHVIRIYDFEQDGDTLLLVMEYAADGSLAEKLALARQPKQPLSVAESLRIALEVAEGLANLHALDAVHRDIKPSNILFDSKGLAKLSDLGLAQISGGRSMRSQLSQPTVHPGTPGYMSPEQERERGYLTPASDVYALGLVLFEMLTGRSFKSMAPGTRLRELRTDAPAWLETLLQDMLAKEPEKRPWDGAEVAGLLRAGLKKQHARQRVPFIERARQDAVRLRRNAAAALAQKLVETKQILDKPCLQTLHVGMPYQAVEARLRQASETWQHVFRKALPVAIGCAGLLLLGMGAQSVIKLIPKPIPTQAITKQGSIVQPPTSIDVTKNSPTPSVSSTLLPPTKTLIKYTATPSVTPSGPWFYIVQKGDIFTEFPMRFGVSLEMLLALNPQIDPKSPTINTFDKIIIPAINQTAIPATIPGMVLIPGGTFRMGIHSNTALVECKKFVPDCSRDSFKDEEPLHLVSLDAFYLDQYEVTNAEFAQFLNILGNQEEGGLTWLTVQSWKNIVQVDGVWQPKNGYADHPVIGANWYGAKAYCQWREARLPTEAEWEYAARGGLEGDIYPWGNTFKSSLANFCDSNCDYTYALKSANDGFKKTAPVGSYAPNGYGLFDMAGNVWEWTSSSYKPYPYDAMDGREDMSSYSSRVLRGGSWMNIASGMRVATRLDMVRILSNDYSGFRCARDP